MSKSWVCKECSEKIDKEFDTCWNCGYSIIDKSNSNDNLDKEKFLKDKKVIDEEIYGSINNFENLHSFRMVLYIFIVINIFSGIGIIVTGFQIRQPIISLYGLLAILMGCYFIFKQIQIIDFLFFLNNKIDRLKKK